MKKCISVCLLALLFSCGPKTEKNTSPSIAFTNFTLIDGSGTVPVTDAVLITTNGRIDAVGSKNEVTIPEGASVVDLHGKYLIPGLINTHGHVGDVIGIDGGHYSAANVANNLGLYARYGITTVISLGGDRKEAVALRAVTDTTVTQHARLYIAGEVINGETPTKAASVADSNHHMGVDFMKIRVDDNLGSGPKISEETYRAVIARSHELGYKIATHMYYLDDAKKLLDAGSDMMAHSVRDVPVDEAFINGMKAKQVCYCPTLTRELSTYVYGSIPDFFTDPFFLKEYDSVMIQPLKDPARMMGISASKSALTYRTQLPVAMANLKTLSDNGVSIVFGTDSGIPTRFMGYFEHMEMSMMADAGLSPMQILVSATKTAAECMGLKGIGMLKKGNYADMVVLDGDPLSDIKNVRKIDAVYIGGKQVRN